MTSERVDPRVPAARECVLRYVLDRHASERGSKVFARLADGTEWTFAEVHARTLEMGAALQDVGARQDDLVLSFMPNGGDAMLAWFGINYIGAACVPLNTAYKGKMLEHALNLARARVLVCHPALAERIKEVDARYLTDVVIAGEATGVDLGERVRVHALADLLARGTQVQPLAHAIAPWDLQAVIHTSGTTGPSKGVMVTYAHLATTCNAFESLTSEDRTMASLPLFHSGGIVAVNRMVLKGGSVAIVESFSTSTFWDVIRETGTTCLTLLGSMAPFLMKAAPSPRDRSHPLRQVVMMPLIDDAVQFGERFGVQVYTTFNMTETSWPIFSDPNPGVRGTCGKARKGVEARIVDANDCELPPNTDGELILRTDAPWTMLAGYLNDPSATAAAWRNGWFHTGDILRCDGEGNFFFVDRLKDAIRRRGENISSFELENEVMQHALVREVAVVGVPSEFGEDDVLAVVALREEAKLDPAELLQYLIARVPYYMVPRYVRYVRELPKTPTQKVQKATLRAEGVTADTWDREKAGIVVRRDVIPNTNKAKR
ncbi:MAG TPA: AMP-binding protein [Ramlibacter sp.]|uniref:AMP-binding protein n=1 Tax=Ramlibacter sp. TaxID=1917967 RepID=UPI002C8E004C|nr:AMP-binding protein [Ramlibacter sp.]HVZ45785.1 AMP-binding protein [Ramlibacter sp.]